MIPVNDRCAIVIVNPHESPIWVGESSISWESQGYRCQATTDSQASLSKALACLKLVGIKVVSLKYS